MPSRLLPVLLSSAQVLICVAAGAAVLVASAPDTTTARTAAPTPGPSITVVVTKPAPVSRPTPTRVAVAAPKAKRVVVVRPKSRPQAVKVAVPSRPVVARKPTPSPSPKIAVVVAPAPETHTKQEQLDRAVARIPGHADPKVMWVLSDAYGSWGTADWYRNVIYISPKVPEDRMYDVVIHEYSHLRSVVPYAGDVDNAVKAMNAFFGGSGLTGAERAADCMARLQGATWTRYTPCIDPRWRDGARRLVSGQRL